jgi:hypothetical protein
MQITKKEQKSATYDVACVGNKYAITGAVVVRNGEVKTMESCVITRDNNSLFVANFSQYGEELHVNYGASIAVEEQQKVLELIQEFKQLIIN